ncbi:MAG: hypothetical protein GY743_23030 [Planctomycetaceae bacterium]|nr:hypothetical protein [Planctomycetaceae bacterium]
MRFTDKRTEVVKPKRQGFDIDMGTTFLARYEGRMGLFLRTYDGVVSLEDPSRTWHDGAMWREYEEVHAEIVISDNVPF